MSAPRRCVRRSISAAAVVISVVSIGSPSAAAPQADETTAAALKKFDTGRAAFEAGHLEEALASFEVSYSLVASPNARLYIARCYRALGKTASAYNAYRLAAREAQDRVTATGEKRYTATRDAANSEISEIEAKLSRVTVAVPSDAPSGLVIRKNGVELSREVWGLAVETDPGEVVVEATGPRLAPFRSVVTLAEKQQARIDVALTRLPTSLFSLKFANKPSGIAVTVDGEALDASTSEQAREVNPGRHTVVVQAPGYTTFRWQRDLADKERHAVEVKLDPVRTADISAPRGTPKWLFFGVAAAAVAGVATASAIAVGAKSSEDEELAKSPFDRSADARDSIRSQSTLANVLFVAGGALGVGAVVLAFTTSWSTKREALRMSPWMTASGGGLGVGRAF